MEMCGTNSDVSPHSAPCDIHNFVILYDPKTERVQSFKIYSRFVLKLYIIIDFFMKTFKNVYDISNVVTLSLRSFRKYMYFYSSISYH